MYLLLLLLYPFFSTFKLQWLVNYAPPRPYAKPDFVYLAFPVNVVFSFSGFSDVNYVIVFPWKNSLQRFLQGRYRGSELPQPLIFRKVFLFPLFLMDGFARCRIFDRLILFVCLVFFFFAFSICICPFILSQFGKFLLRDPPILLYGFPCMQLFSLV